MNRLRLNSQMPHITGVISAAVALSGICCIGSVCPLLQSHLDFYILNAYDT
jgi:hypothetical protein